MKPDRCTRGVRPVVDAGRRRISLLGAAIAALVTRAAGSAGPAAAGSAEPSAPGARDRRFIDAAFAMKALAESWGDQPYGAVLVLDGRIVGEGPSRVIQRNDPDAHAEREAIRDARRRLGRDRLDGSILYSTSRPCPLCERAANDAGVARMLHGRAPTDGGPPRS